MRNAALSGRLWKRPSNWRLVGLPPFPEHQLTLLQAVQGRIERAFLQAQQAARDGLHVQGDAEAVIGTPVEGLQDEQFQGALQLIAARHRSPRILG